jgi:hypothetical protein
MRTGRSKKRSHSSDSSAGGSDFNSSTHNGDTGTPQP